MTSPRPQHTPHKESKPSAAGGWGSVETLTSILTQEQVPVLGSELLMKQNKPDGFMCVSCSWAKPAHPHTFEFCENGAKATVWEITDKRTTPEFFAAHTVSELRTWSDHALEENGRLTYPMRYDAASDKYQPVTWERAFAEIGQELRALDPKSVIMAGGTRISSQYCQVRAGGDTAAITGICKAVIEADDEAQRTGSARRVDADFIAEHAAGFDEFAAYCRAQDWRTLEVICGIAEAELRLAAETYMASNATIFNYGMGVTQHEYGVETVQMIVNLMLLRGNIGKPGAGISPVRGHSNVQGQRTVGISEKTKLVPLDKLKELYDFEPPREDGLTTVDACEGILKGSVRGFVSLGGNFARAIPDRAQMEKAWTTLRLSVQVATKLNRTHLLPGDVTYLLPCLGRIEIDEQATGPQAVSMEDSTACIHGSRGQRERISEDALSEPAIIAGMAKATLPPNPKVDWDAWVGDYAMVRDAIEATWPDQFKDFNKRLFTPGGFPRPLAARERKWKTPNGKANFTVPESLNERRAEGPDIYQLMTLRADGQFNTTVYTEDDRFRGVTGGRNVVLMNERDIERLNLNNGDRIVLTAAADDGVTRELGDLVVMPYDIPEKCIAGYYPECNVLIPVWHYAKQSKVPAAKSVPVRIALQHAKSEDLGSRDL